MKIHVTNIEWDTTDEGGNPLPKKEEQEMKLQKAEQILIDNGIEADEAKTVLQALGYALLDKELYPNGI